MDVKRLLEKIEGVAAPVIASMGFEVADCEYINEHGRSILRICIDKEGGVKMEDCEAVARAVSGVLDVENVVPHRYNLEVSSPGLDRRIKKLSDFEKYAGQMIRVKTREPINDGRANYFGTLNGVKGADVYVTVDGVEYTIPFDMISKAKIEYKKNKE